MVGSKVIRNAQMQGTRIPRAEAYKQYAAVTAG